MHPQFNAIMASDRTEELRRNAEGYLKSLVIS